MRDEKKSKKKIYLNKFYTTFQYSSLLIILMGIMGPLEIYAGNSVEFEFGFNDFFWLFLGAYGLLGIIGSFIVALLPNNIYKVINIILFILGIEFYLQNMFFNRKLVMNNGGRMNWDTMGHYSVINLLLWIIIAMIIISVAIITRNTYWKKISRTIVLFLVVIQLIAAIPLIIKCPKKRIDAREWRIDASSEYMVSEGDNILVIILDAYGNNIFEKAATDYPEILNTVKDFTYYNNAHCNYCQTDYAYAVMFAGDVANQEPDWRQDTWAQQDVQDFFDAMHKEGYTCRVTSQDSTNVFGDVKLLVGKFDNARELDVTYNPKLLFSLYTKMSLYKYMPYVAKPKFEVMSSSFTDVIATESWLVPRYKNDVYYIELLNRGITIDKSTDKLFSIVHIQGMHSPYDIDRECNYMGEDYNGNPEEVALGLDKIISIYLDDLKEIGVYDDATIIIMADHGNSDYYQEIGLQPIFLIKRPGENHDALQRNSAPISYEDFRATILSLADSDNKDFGKTIFEYGEGEKRKRTIGINPSNMKYYTYCSDKEELQEMVGVDN